MGKNNQISGTWNGDKTTKLKSICDVYFLKNVIPCNISTQEEILCELFIIEIKNTNNG